MATFILTVVGDDRPGLVSAISTPITLHGGSWERGQMSRLAGKFAGIVLVAVPDASLDALSAELEALDALGLRVVVERTGGADRARRAATATSSCSAATTPASWPRSPPRSLR